MEEDPEFRLPGSFVWAWWWEFKLQTVENIHFTPSALKLFLNKHRILDKSGSISRAFLHCWERLPTYICTFAPHVI